ncbi:MAG: hypothetical protein KAQ83_02395 [Nanoarchaeota archaeon]|nr:hypothetical protein [Nanoarchaeota archaeon]
MDRNHALKNILQKENWESINKAPERMNTNQNDSLRSLESKSDNENKNEDLKKLHKEEEFKILHKNEEIMQHNIQKLKETIDALERIMNTKLNDQANLVNQVVEKMNKMIANYNELEKRMNACKSQTTIKKSPKKENKKAHQDTSTMETEISCADVSIEKIFNCANKKF